MIPAAKGLERLFNEIRLPNATAKEWMLQCLHPWIARHSLQRASRSAPSEASSAYTKVSPTCTTHHGVQVGSAGAQAL